MRRGLLILATVVVVIGGVLALMAFFSGRDEATIGSEPGVAAPAETSDVLARGNVVVDYRDPAQATKVRSLAQDLGASADPALVEAGAAVVVREADVDGIVARAYKRRLEARNADDPELRTFVEYWLGRGRDNGGR